MAEDKFTNFLTKWFKKPIPHVLTTSDEHKRKCVDESYMMDSEARPGTVMSGGLYTENKTSRWYSIIVKASFLPFADT